MKQSPTATPQTIPQAVERMLASGNACDRRKAVDIQALLEAGRGPWNGRFELLGLAAASGGALAVVCALSGTASLVWAGEAKQAAAFRFVLVAPPRYPLSMPRVQFVKPVPFNPHVVHAEFLTEPAGLPAELQGYLRQGVGYMCFLRANEWNAARDSLALAVWQVSRILSGRIHPEAGGLNRAAGDFMLRMRNGDGQRIELGPPLPYPAPGSGQPAEQAPAMEWEDAPEKEVRHDA